MPASHSQGRFLFWALAMVNVSLRAYIWHQKSVEEQIAREVTCDIVLF